MKPIDRGDAPPFDLALFAADAVVPKDQRLALDRVPGWFSNAGEDAGVLSLDGKMIDRPHLRQAQRLLSRSQFTST